MSTTFSLVCRETNLGVWIGQGRGAQMTCFYSGQPEIMERLARFLNAHKGKSLELVCDDQDTWDGKEFEEVGEG